MEMAPKFFTFLQLRMAILEKCPMVLDKLRILSCLTLVPLTIRSGASLWAAEGCIPFNILIFESRRQAAALIRVHKVVNGNS